MQVTPDSAYRIVLTKKIRRALNLKPGEPLDISISAGAVFLTPVKSKYKLARKGKLRICAGDIPAVNVENAIDESRRYFRL
jgi:AbrB family looped-hinge helix DNA binding protein